MQVAISVAVVAGQALFYPVLPALAAPPGRPVPRAVDGAALAARVKEIFRTRCLECHGGSKVQGGVKILDYDLLVNKKKEIVPNEPDNSPLFERVSAADEDSAMPPSGQPRLPADDITTIRSWIAAGAPAFPADVAPPAEQEKDPSLRNVAGVDYVHKQILAHLRTLAGDARLNVRYFSINHVLTSGATREELELQRQALAKAINHLSLERKVVRPRPIDAPTATIFAVDLRELGWHKRLLQRVGSGSVHGGSVHGSTPNLFDLALLEYPYGITYEDSDTFDRLVDEYFVPAGMVRPISFVRADWFVSVATQPPLYEDFLQLPFELDELEARLGVASQNNLDEGIARRAGMAVSGVSRNNRVVERHPADQGAYWKSFDFRTNKGQENIFLDPLDLHPAGGEMIFNLPNGLQGYLLADAKGRRLDVAPTDIVTDKFAEDKTVRNGLSCMRCHETGMKSFVDTVRPAVDKLPGSPGFSKRDVLRIYPEQSELDQYLEEDGGRFLRALEQALGSPQRREPLTPVSQRFLDAPLQLAAASGELGLADTHGLTELFRSPQFVGLGLVSLGGGGVVRRDMWEDYYDQVVRSLGLGIPVVPLDGLTRRDFQPGSHVVNVELSTSKKNNVFAPGDELVIFVTNRSGQPLFVELIGSSAQGNKIVLVPSTTQVRGGEQLRYPPSGSLKVQAALGKEQITLFASDRHFPAGQLLRGKGVVDRVIHDFYELHPGGGRRKLAFDPAVRLVKKTIEIETR